MALTNFFAFEIHHAFPTNALNDANSEALNALMGSDFDVTMQGNLVAMFKNQMTADAFKALPPAVQKVFQDAGWGVNQHSGSHPGVSKFVDDRMTIILDAANQWSDEGRKLAVWELHDFAVKLAKGQVKIGDDIVGIKGGRDAQSQTIRDAFNAVDGDGNPINRTLKDADLASGTVPQELQARIDAYSEGFDDRLPGQQAVGRGSPRHIRPSQTTLWIGRAGPALR